MSLFGGGKSVSISQPMLAGLQLSTSNYGLPVPIIYGTMRVPGNLIDYDDFTAVPHTTKTTVGGGLSGSTIKQTEYSYTTMAMLGLCEGPIGGINVVWADKDKASLELYGFELFEGSLTQAPWGYLVTNHPAKAIGYSGTAYVASAPMDLGGTGSLKNFSFEVEGFMAGGAGGQDAEAADVIPDFLTNVFYGAGWNPARIANLSIGQSGDITSSYRRYCQATGLFVSPAYLEQRAASDHLGQLLVATNAGAVFSEAVLKIFPYGDQPVTGNGVTFTPYNTPIYDLTPDHLLPTGGPGSDLVTVTRTALEDSFNTIPVEYYERATFSASADYNASVVQDPDPVDADLYGVRQGATVALHMLTRREASLQISRILAQRSIYIRNTYTFRLPWRYILLDPMDLVTLTDPKFGLDRKVVRLTNYVEDDQGTLTFTAEEWPFGVASATLYSTQENDGTTANTAIDPGDAIAPIIFDVPLLFSESGATELGIGTSGGEWWGGAEVWASFDGTDYTLVGTILKKAQFGETTSILAAGTGFDVTHSVGVDLTVSEGTLASSDDQSAQDLLDLCYLDGELLSPATATLTSPFNYTLSRIQRGAFGTQGTTHASGTPFLRIDDSLFRYRIPDSRIGSPVYIKLVSVNIYGGGRQDISTVTAYMHTPASANIDPPFPDTVTLTLSGTRPASTADYNRANLIEHTMSLISDPDNPSTTTPQYATVAWTPVIIYPASYLTGYETVIYTGTDPNDENAYAMPKVVSPPSSIATVYSLPPNYTGAQTLRAAVRAMYGTDPSSWRDSVGSVILSPGTTPLNIPITLEVTQVSSDLNSVTFTVTPHDPLGKFVSATCFISWAGLTSVIDNGTGLPVGASKSMNFLAAYSFTANLNPQFRGGGYVKFHMPATGRGDGYVTWFAAEKDQDAAPATELAIDNAGLPSITVNAPNNTATLKWLVSLSAYPTAATVIASGAVASGGSPFHMTALLGGGVDMALGDTIYFTGVPFDVFGTAGQTIQCQKTRETITASKTLRFVAAGAFIESFYALTLYPAQADATNTGAMGFAAAGPQNTGTPQPFPILLARFSLAENCVLTAITMGAYANVGATTLVISRLQRFANDGSIAATVATVAAPLNSAWSVTTASCSENTTGNTYGVMTFLRLGAGQPTTDALISYFEITYTSNNTQATV